MTVRNRYRFVNETGTRHRYDTGVTSSFTRTSQSETTEDVVQEGDNNSFLSTKWIQTGSTLTGRYGDRYGWDNMPSAWSRTNVNATNHLSLPALNLQNLATETLKRTNPSRSSVEGLVSLFELRELPGMVRESWQLSTLRLFKHVPKRVWRNLSRVAKLNLMVQFGILPLISDAQKLMIFQKYVDQRIDELTRLRERGLKRTIDLTRDSATSTFDAAIESTGVSMTGIPVTKTTTRTVRGHARWRLISELPLKTDSQIRAEAIRIVSGSKLDFVTMYEAMPWSWLIDYFVNLGDFVQAYRNSLGVVPSNPRIMTHLETVTRHLQWRYTHQNGRQVILSRYHCTSSSKRRQSIAAGLTAQETFLTGRQLSILGSLSVLKAR